MGKYEAKTGPFLQPSQYDFFRQIVQLGLPGLGTLYFAIAQIWGLPYAEQIVGTIAALTVFFGIVLTISRGNYKKSDEAYDGELVVLPGENGDPERQTYSFEVTTPLFDLPNKDTLNIKVKSPN